MKQNFFFLKYVYIQHHQHDMSAGEGVGRGQGQGIQFNIIILISQSQSLIFQGPFVLLNKRVHNFFHRIIWDELFNSQRGSCNWIKMTYTRQMFFDVLSLVGYAWWSDDGILEDFKADFTTNEVWDFPFTTTIIDLSEQVIQFRCVILLKGESSINS